MSVHVDEIHTDVVASGGAREPEASSHAPRHLGAAQDAWQEARREDAMRRRRTTAEGFDD